MCNQFFIRGRLLKLRLFLLINCQEPSSMPQTDRLIFTGNWNTSAYRVLEWPFKIET